MKVYKVLLDFVLFSVTDKVTFFRGIILKLTSNPAFPSPDPTLAELKAAVDSFELAILAAQDGGRTFVSSRNDHDKATTLLFRHSAHYVEKMSNNDETKILSSGFNPTHQPVAHEKAELTVRDGKKSGSVHLDGKSHSKGAAYIWQKSLKENPTLDSDWETITTTTQSSYYLEGLTPATYVKFRFAVVTPTGITDFCAPVTKLIN